MSTDQETSHDDVLSLFEQHGVFPRRLADEYPHVLASITEAWANPAQASACFDHLMLAEPRRKLGFPEAIMSEIFAISTLYDRLHVPAKVSPFDFWTRMIERGESGIPVGGHA